jgi:hypothetical protein
MADPSDCAARPLREGPTGFPYKKEINPDRALGGGAAHEQPTDAQSNTDSGFLERFVPVLLRCLSHWHT